MVNEQTKHALTRAIIGNIREAFDPTSIDIDEIEPPSDEEVAEMQADYQASRHLYPDLTPEQTDRIVASGMKVVRFIFYKQAMQRRGLAHLDYHEYMNMAVEPEVPEG